MEPQQQPQNEQKAANDILLNTFLISKKKYRVLLHYDALIWEKENTVNNKTTVPLSDILAVRLSTSKKDHQPIVPQPGLPSTSLPDQHFLIIHYVKRDTECDRDRNRWRKHTIGLYNADYRIVKQWHGALVGILAVQQRPKSLLIFINPYGGRRKAMETYEKYSKPLFQLAGIDVSCVISQRANQIRDILMTQSLDQYDAICCVGGDGTFSELFNGLIQRTIRDRNLDAQRPEYLPIPRIPIGIIPAGSTDTVAYCLHGTTDIKTAVIHIILGVTRGLDLSSVCNQAGLLRFYASIMCYGYLGDVASDSEKFRWMGPKRYEYSGFKKIVANRGYEIELTFAQHEIDAETKRLRCHVDCSRCPSVDEDDPLSKRTIDFSIASSDLDAVQDNCDKLTWKTIRGKYFMVGGANISCACSRSPSGFAPFCHLGDGYIDIIMIRRTSIFNILRLLLRLKKANPKIDNLPFVEIYRTTKFFLRPQKSSLSRSGDLQSISGSCQPITSPSSHSKSHWNCDGEIIHDSDLLVSSHRQLIQVFMRGSYPSLGAKSSCCGLCSS